MYIQVLSTNLLSGVKAKNILSAMGELEKSTDLNKDIKRVTALFDEKQGKLIALVYWKDRKSMLEGSPKLNRSPEAAMLFKLMDASKMTIESCELILDKTF